MTAEGLGPNYIVPGVFHPNVASTVAAAVGDAAAKDTAAAKSPGTGR